MNLTEIDFTQATQFFTYQEFKEHVNSLLTEGKVTGATQSEALLQTSEMNVHRMMRIDKNFSLSKDVLTAIQSIDRNWTWYLIIEGWCGDGSQNAPIISQIAEHSPNIDLKIILRDDNPEIMDNYLTNGGKAIPKLICVDTESGNEIGTWGPRPQQIQDSVMQFKKDHPEVDKAEFAKYLHRLYAKDKGQSLQNEFLMLITKWNDKI